MWFSGLAFCRHLSGLISCCFCQQFQVCEYSIIVYFSWRIFYRHIITSLSFARCFSAADMCSGQTHYVHEATGKRSFSLPTAQDEQQPQQQQQNITEQSRGNAGHEGLKGASARGRYDLRTSALALSQPKTDHSYTSTR